MSDDSQKSHLSTGGADKPSGPVNQHKRLAMGQKVKGTSNPHGAKAPTEHKLGNAKVTY